MKASVKVGWHSDPRAWVPTAHFDETQTLLALVLGERGKMEHSAKASNDPERSEEDQLSKTIKMTV